MTLPIPEVHLYEFTGADPTTNYRTTRVIYIGESERIPAERMGEHLAKKPWGDTVTGWRVIEVGHPDKASAWAAEKAAIERLLPPYNDEYFPRDKRGRIPHEVQVAQRWARDDAAGRERWQPSGRGRAPRSPAARSKPARRLMSKRARRRWLALAGWSAAAVAVWAGLTLSGAVGTPQTGAGAGFGSATAGAVWVSWYVAPRRRRRLIEAGLTLGLFAAVVVWAWATGQLQPA